MLVSWFVSVPFLYFVNPAELGKNLYRLYNLRGSKRKRTKRKGTRAARSCGQPVLLKSAGSLKTHFVQTVQAPLSADPAVLGYVTKGR